MALLLRRLRNKRHLEDSVAPEGDVQADVLKSFATTNNALSLWEVDDDCGNLYQIVAAVGATRDHLDRFDYALIDRQYIDGGSFHLVPRSGNSPDSQANEWHETLLDLTGRSVLDLAFLTTSHARFGRFNKSQVEASIRESVASGSLQPGAMNEKLRDALGL